MHRHTIDPLSAVLGLIAIGAGVAVASGRADSLAVNAIWWIAIVALLLGIALMPWSRIPLTKAPDPTPDMPADGRASDGSSNAPT